jgi:hypothetical protein
MTYVPTDYSNYRVQITASFLTNRIKIETLTLWPCLVQIFFAVL